MPSKRSRAWTRRKKEDLALDAERRLLAMDRPRVYYGVDLAVTVGGTTFKGVSFNPLPPKTGRWSANGVCVKKSEAGPMTDAETVRGLEGDELEQALKDDAKIDPGTKHAAPRPSAPSAPEIVEPVKFAPPPTPEPEAPFSESERRPVAEPPPTSDLPAGMKMALWVPIKQGDGTTIYQCSIEGFGLRATASSRRKQRALAYALEDMARQMIEADQ
jgi:hypothetical protein